MVFSFGFGGGSSKSTQNYSGTQNTTVDPALNAFRQQGFGAFDALTSGILGQYMQNQQGQQGGNVPFNPNATADTGFFNFDWSQYNNQPPANTTAPTALGPNTFIAPFSADSNQFFQMARDYQGSGIAPQLQALAGQVNPGTIGFNPTQGAQVASISGYNAPQAAATLGADYMARYANPYENQVVNTTLAGYDTAADRAAAANRARRDAGAAFGDRAAIADAVFNADTMRNRAATEAQLRAQGFNTALGAGLADANRTTQANVSNAQLQAAALAQDYATRAAQAQQNAALAQQTGQFNANLGFQTGQANIANALAGQTLQGQLLGQSGALAGNEAAMRANLLQSAGQTQDEKLQAQKQEALDLLLARFGLTSGAPWNQTVTESGTSTTKGKSSNFGFGFGGGK